MSARFFVAQYCARDRDGSSLIAGSKSRKRRSSGSTETIRGCRRTEGPGGDVGERESGDGVQDGARRRQM